MIPPFLQLPNLKPISWQLNGLPDFLWIQAIREETGTLAAANEALDLLDEYVPATPKSLGQDDQRGAVAESNSEDEGAQASEGFTPRPNTHLDGRISTFPLVPEDQRGNARQKLETFLPWALPDALGHALALYAECPAAWLYEDWAKTNEVDPGIGVDYLKQLVAPLLDPRGRPSSQARAIPIARGFTHNTIFLVRDMAVVELLPKYPDNLSREDQLHVEQWNRNTWNIHQTTSDRTIADAWIRHFWKQNWSISPCDPEPTHSVPLDEMELEEGEPSEEGRGRRQRTVSSMRRSFLTAIDVLGRELRAAQSRIEIDLYNPTMDEVNLGLASRVFRLLRHLVSDPDLWTNEMGPHVVRSMIDARIISAWLLRQNDPELFQKFKEYGMGKRKLFKLKLEDLMDREDMSSDEGDQALHEQLEAEVNQDVMEEFIKIDVGGSFSGKSIRDMAKEADLAELYSLNYQPLSTEAHGEWGSLIAFDLRHCGNPLHRYHRLGSFDTSPHVTIHLGWVRHAFGLAQDAITEVFESYGVEVESLFGECLDRLEKARQDLAP